MSFLIHPSSNLKFSGPEGMMGIGSLGGGGPSSSSSSSTSSSHLSASAQPFTVERSNSRPVPNQPLQFSDSPPYSTFGHTWNFANPAGVPSPDYRSLEMDFDSMVIPSAPLATENCSFNYKPERGPWSSVNPCTKTSVHPFFVDREIRPYYPHVHVSNNPLASLSESSYDLFPSAGLASSSAEIPNQVDYTQNLSALDFSTQWDGVWNGIVDRNLGKQTVLDGYFPLDKIAGSDSLATTNYKKQGCNTVERGDLLGKDFSITYGQLSDSFGIQSCSGWMRTEPIPLDQSQQSPVNSMNCQIPYNPCEKGIQQSDSCVSGFISVTKSSPVFVTSPSPIGTRLGLQKPAGKSVDSFDFTCIHQDKGLGDNNLLREKEPHVVFDLKVKECSSSANQCMSSKAGLQETFAFLPSIVDEPLSMLQTAHTPNNGLRLEYESQVPKIDVLTSFRLPSENAQSIKSPEKFFDCFEHNNTAIDSPCWKGAPACHSSLFDGIETKSQHNPMDSKPCHLDLKAEDQTSPPLDDAIRSASEKNDEDQVQLKLGCASRDHRSADGAATRLKSSTLMYEKGVQFVEESCKPRDNDNVSEFQVTEKLDVRVNDCSRTRANIQAAVVDSLMNHCDTIKGGALAAENVLRSAPLAESKTELPKPQGSGSAPKLDFQTFIKALKNVSDVLLYNCSSDSCALEEEDYDTIKDVMNNLNALVSKKTVDVAHSSVPIVPKGDTYHKVRESVDPLMTPEEIRNYKYYGKKAQSFQHFPQMTDNLAFIGDDKMAQSIKKVLDENFLYGDEIQSQALIFKNLWLEAEAKLCSISFRSHFDRVKIEIERCMSNHTKDNAASSEKGSVNDSQDLSASDVMTTNAENGSLQEKTIQIWPSGVDDVEQSVMARLHIIKCREDLKLGQQSDISPAASADNLAKQSSHDSERRCQVSAGSKDSTSSSWEHVLKEDFSWR